MHTKEAIKFALTASNEAVMSVIEEMDDAPTTFPTPNGGCHPLWVLGHLTLVEGLLREILFGEKNPAGEWEQYFGQGTVPSADAAKNPALYEVQKKYLALRESNL